MHLQVPGTYVIALRIGTAVVRVYPATRVLLAEKRHISNGNLYKKHPGTERRLKRGELASLEPITLM